MSSTYMFSVWISGQQVFTTNTIFYIIFFFSLTMLYWFLTVATNWVTYDNRNLFSHSSRDPTLKSRRNCDWFFLESLKENLLYAFLLASGDFQKSLVFLGLKLCLLEKPLSYLVNYTSEIKDFSSKILL